MTENDIKAELSYAYVHAVAAHAGFACDRPSLDRDSVDAVVRAHGQVTPQSVLFSPALDLQLKATSTVLPTGASFPFQLSIKNYNDLRALTYSPRLLIVLALPDNIAEWLSHTDEQLIMKRCAYWLNLKNFPATDNTATITVNVSRANLFSMAALTTVMTRVSMDEDIGNAI